MEADARDLHMNAVLGASDHRLHLRKSQTDGPHPSKGGTIGHD